MYCSPILQAAPGSEHGYDVVDHDRIDPHAAGRTGGRHWLPQPRDRGLGDRRRHRAEPHGGRRRARETPPGGTCCGWGANRPFAAWFDIEWATGRVRLPVLGDGVDPATDLQIVDGELRYAEHRFPIAPGTETPASAGAVHERQHYELVNFRRADTEQNYRRFFAVTTLAGLRIEDEAVAAATHREILALGARGRRRRPASRSSGRAGRPRRLPGLAARASAPDAWITVEKILEPGEVLPVQWPVAGTTGYDALAEVNAVFIDPAAEDGNHRDLPRR